MIIHVVAAKIGEAGSSQLHAVKTTLVQAMQPVINWAETHMAQVAEAQMAYDRRNR